MFLRRKQMLLYPPSEGWWAPQINPSPPPALVLAPARRFFPGTRKIPCGSSSCFNPPLPQPPLARDTWSLSETHGQVGRGEGCFHCWSSTSFSSDVQLPQATEHPGEVHLTLLTESVSDPSHFHSWRDSWNVPSDFLFSLFTLFCPEFSDG